MIGARRWGWLLLAPALAAGAAEPAAQAYLYRYHNADGTLAISATLNQQAIYSGYQMLDDNGRVIKSVPAAPPGRGPGPSRSGVAAFVRGPR